MYTGFQQVNFGTTEFDGTGEDLRDGGLKIDTMFKDLFNQGTTFTPYHFGAVGNGVFDDTQAFKDCIAAAVAVDGKFAFPPAPVSWNVTDTIEIVPVGAGAQCWVNGEGWGERNTSIIYNGAGSKPVFKIVGLKSGVLKGINIKIADGITGVQAWEIGCSTNSNSTGGFTFENCVVNLGNGINNIGWRLGTQFGGTNGDISQIKWDNCNVFGVAQAAGSIGWSVIGTNTLQLTWDGCSTALAETNLSCTAGGSLFWYGGGASNTSIDFYLGNSNSFKISGGRFEAGKQFMVVPSASTHPNIEISCVQLASYVPANGRLIDMNRTGTLNIFGFKVERATAAGGDHTSSMIYLGGTTGQGTCNIIGGGFRATDPFYTVATVGMWRLNIQDVARFTTDSNQSLNYNKTHRVITPGGTTGNQTIQARSGTVNIAAGQSSIVVTNVFVDVDSIIYATIRTNDTTALIKNIVPAAGSFTIRLNANATAETSIGFVVFN